MTKLAAKTGQCDTGNRLMPRTWLDWASRCWTGQAVQPSDSFVERSVRHAALGCTPEPSIGSDAEAVHDVKMRSSPCGHAAMPIVNSAAVALHGPDNAYKRIEAEVVL